MPAKRPTERNLQLGRALCDARLAAGIRRQEDVAKMIGRSQPTIARIENGTRPPTLSELTKLLDLYQPANRAEIERLAHPDEAGGLPLNEKFGTILRLAEQAEAIRAFTSERIPMTLQCERYVLKQYSLFDKSIPPKDVLLLHARRTDILALERPPSFDAIMTVSSLLRMPGGQEDLVKEQAQHMLNLLDTVPQLTIRVLDLTANIPYIDTDFTVIQMPGRRRDVVYVPFGLDGHIINDKAKVKERETFWRLAQGAALSLDDTRSLLHVLAERGHSVAAWPDSQQQSS